MQEQQVLQTSIEQDAHIGFDNEIFEIVCEGLQANHKVFYCMHSHHKYSSNSCFFQSTHLSPKTRKQIQKLDHQDVTEEKTI